MYKRQELESWRVRENEEEINGIKRLKRLSENINEMVNVNKEIRHLNKQTCNQT